MKDDTTINTVELATELAVAWLGNQNNRVNADEVPAFLRSVHAVLVDLSGDGADTNPAAPAPAEETKYDPAVTVRKSLASKDHIVSMIDGKPYRTLRRHLSTHGLTPDEYRARYNLKADYPMVAQSYSEARREMAKRIGLGAKGRTSRAETKDSPAPVTPEPSKKPTGRRTRKPAADAE